MPNKTKVPELDRWLTCESRCFGDKGDVEDITEGQPKLNEDCATTGIWLANVIVSNQRTSYQL